MQSLKLRPIQRQREMEEEYLRIYKTQPLHAQDLQAFSDKILNSALDLADRLQEKLFTLMTQDIQQEYLFHEHKSKENPTL